MTPQRNNIGVGDANSASEGLIRLSEVVKGIVSQLSVIDKKLDAAAETEKETAASIASILTRLAVAETQGKHESAQRRRTEKLLSRVLWFLAAEIAGIISAIVGGGVLWYLTKG